VKKGKRGQGKGKAGKGVVPSPNSHFWQCRWQGETLQRKSLETTSKRRRLLPFVAYVTSRHISQVLSVNPSSSAKNNMN